MASFCITCFCNTRHNLLCNNTILARVHEEDSLTQTLKGEDKTSQEIKTNS